MHNINLSKEEVVCECEKEVTDFMHDILPRKIRCSILIFQIAVCSTCQKIQDMLE